jgi:hypothetical protein
MIFALAGATGEENQMRTTWGAVFTAPPAAGSAWSNNEWARTGAESKTRAVRMATPARLRAISCRRLFDRHICASSRLEK